MADPKPMHLENDPWSEKSPYEVLGVGRDDDRGKVKAAYRAIQKRARRGDELWTAAQVANETLTKPKKRLVIDLLEVSEKRAYRDMVEQYGETTFDLVPADPTPLLLRATDLEWGDVLDDFAVPVIPKVTFVRLTDAPVETDELCVEFGRESNEG